MGSALLICRVVSSLPFGKRDTLGFFGKKVGILGFFVVLVGIFTQIHLATLSASLEALFNILDIYN